MPVSSSIRTKFDYRHANAHAAVAYLAATHCVCSVRMKERVCKCAPPQPKKRRQPQPAVESIAFRGQRCADNGVPHFSWQRLKRLRRAHADPHFDSRRRPVTNGEQSGMDQATDRSVRWTRWLVERGGGGGESVITMDWCVVRRTHTGVLGVTQRPAFGVPQALNAVIWLNWTTGSVSAIAMPLIACI